MHTLCPCACICWLEEQWLKELVIHGRSLDRLSFRGGGADRIGLIGSTSLVGLWLADPHKHGLSVLATSARPSNALTSNTSFNAV